MRNLTEVALKNKVLVWYFIVVTAIGGIFAYNKLGRMEDPQFTIRQMVVSAAWPGATSGSSRSSTGAGTSTATSPATCPSSARTSTRPATPW